MRTTSMRSFDEPCGSWQVAQFSRTGACSHSTGPRISVWQLVQLSATELPVFSALTLLIEPCGLWHDEHDILPSRTGMCATARSVLATCRRWQVAHSSVSVAFTSWCSERLRAVHAVAGRAGQVARSCALPSHPAWLPRLWQVRHVCADFAGLQLRELPDVSLRVVVDVRLPRPVAALAAVRRRRRARILRLPVRNAGPRNIPPEPEHVLCLVSRRPSCAAKNRQRNLRGRMVFTPCERSGYDGSAHAIRQAVCGFVIGPADTGELDYERLLEGARA